MRQRYLSLLMAWMLVFVCAAAGCTASKPETSHPTNVPTQTAAPAPTMTTVPTVTTMPTEPVEQRFNPAVLAAQVPEDVKAQMKQVFPAQIMPYYDLTAEDVHIERVFAIFDHAYALYVEVDQVGYADAQGTETINGVYFVFPNGQKLYVYSDGRFYSLREAIDEEIISVDQLLVIRDNYRSTYPWSEP